MKMVHLNGRASYCCVAYNQTMLRPVVLYSEKLSAWLSSRGRTPSKYSHMMCFGHSHGGTTRTPLSHQHRRKQSVINNVILFPLLRGGRWLINLIINQYRP